MTTTDYLNAVLNRAWEDFETELRLEALKQNPPPENVAICPHGMVEVYCRKCGGWAKL